MTNYRCYFLDKNCLGKAMAFRASTDAAAVIEAEFLISGDGGKLDRFEVWECNRLVISGNCEKLDYFEVWESNRLVYRRGHHLKRLGLVVQVES